jgi:hypothetical protein
MGLKQYNSGELETCIQTFKQILTLSPNHPLSTTMVAKVHKEMKASLVSDEFSIEHIPFLQQSLHSLNELSFTPQENYVLSRLNGTSSVQNIIRLSPIQEIQALMIFKKFAREGLIGFLPPPNTEEERGRERD